MHSTESPLPWEKGTGAMDDAAHMTPMMIFDADNLIDVICSGEVNSQYLDKQKPDFIQCYLGSSKNKTGVVAWSLAYTSYTITNRFSGSQISPGAELLHWRNSLRRLSILPGYAAAGPPCP